MLQRYIGNKNSIIDSVLTAIERIAEPGDLIVDAFSGSIAVSVALKEKGYRVASNDANLLSWIYSVAYLKHSGLPELNPALANLLPRTSRVAEDQFPYDDPVANQWAALLDHLTEAPKKDLPKSAWRQDIFQHYCEEGARSEFVSSRGRAGRRRFFTSENARLIDRALNRIRWWWRSGLIDEGIRCILTACLLDGVEKISNTQGTYHDFPRDFYDSRALKRLQIRAPETRLMSGRTDHIIGKAEDSLEFVRRVPDHTVLYVDPPYNFRQYSSYYFFPNLISKYPDIDDLDEYFSSIEYVRGQNMEDDFSSTFCSSTNFLPSLRSLVERSRCRFVVMSYFDGKNHWSDFKSGADSRGKLELERFFQSELFVPGTMTFVPVDRLNYQSYGGYQARPVKEFLFVAEKRPEASEPTSEASVAEVDCVLGRSADWFSSDSMV